MFSRLARFETQLFERLQRPRLSGFVERGSFWLLLVSAVLFVCGFLPGAVGSIANGFSQLSFLFLAVLLIILGYRWVHHHLLWTVRNRLVVLCLLMGLAPVVLLLTLGGFAAYIFAGQYATNAAIVSLDETIGKLKDRSSAFAAPVASMVEQDPKITSLTIPGFAQVSSPLGAEPGFELFAWRDSIPMEIRITHAGEKGTAHLPELKAPLAKAPLPNWVRPGFSGIVRDHGKLYMRAVNGYDLPGHTVTVMASLPLGVAELDAVASNLGAVKIMSGFNVSLDAKMAADKKIRYEAMQKASSGSFDSMQGGTVPSATHFYDIVVYFTAPLPITDWDSGANESGAIGVISRPTALYQRLFATSVKVGVVVREILGAVAILFSLAEILAFLMALRLSRTITGSIAGLYRATTEIDSGNLTHRILVERHDQLGALSTSFNTMTGSLQHLLEQQREKERIQSELEIAHEVQNNLFPHAPFHIPGFELHGVCKPARTVSGDYYDFIIDGAGDDTMLCLALGDISGKGISAALLMASLHSAVRAYRVAGGELGDGPEPLENLSDIPAATFASPGKLLGLLNRHLYTSTQPEKYATLFVASYDPRTRRMTYSNGGQLPPLLLCADGSVKRLDCGGSVVGLLDGMQYEEATVSFSPGDLLIAYSDGVTEPENEYGEFGEDRLLEVIRQNQHQSLSAISNQTMRALRSWIGTAEQPDDITLVLARQL